MMKTNTKTPIVHSEKELKERRKFIFSGLSVIFFFGFCFIGLWFIANLIKLYPNLTVWFWVGVSLMLVCLFLGLFFAILSHLLRKQIKTL